MTSPFQSLCLLIATLLGVAAATPSHRQVGSMKGEMEMARRSERQEVVTPARQFNSHLCGLPHQFHRLPAGLTCASPSPCGTVDTSEIAVHCCRHSAFSFEYCSTIACHEADHEFKLTPTKSSKSSTYRVGVPPKKQNHHAASPVSQHQKNQRYASKKQQLVHSSAKCASCWCHDDVDGAVDSVSPVSACVAESYTANFFSAPNCANSSYLEVDQIESGECYVISAPGFRGAFSMMINTTNDVNNVYSMWFFTDSECQQLTTGSGEIHGGGCTNWPRTPWLGGGPSVYITPTIDSPYTIQWNTNISCQIDNFIGAEPNECFLAPYAMTNSIHWPNQEGWILTIEGDEWILSQYQPTNSGGLCGTFIQNLTMPLGQVCQQPNAEYYNNIYIVPTEGASASRSSRSVSFPCKEGHRSSQQKKMSAECRECCGRRLA